VVFGERCASERFCSDVSEVVSSGVLDEVDGVRFLGVADHGVAWGDPFEFVGDAAASGTVDEDTGVCLCKQGLGLRGEAEFAKEDAEAEDSFRAAYGLEEFSSTGGIAYGGGEAARDHEATTADGRVKEWRAKPP
jgi:hypothetical protein